MALVVLRARSSSAPAQPTQNRYSTSAPIFPSTTGTSKSSSPIQSARRAAPIPHGSPLFSRFFSIPAASTGNADSISTWCRRIPSMWSMCSMSTGHSSTHAPQFVHDHSTSGSMTPRAAVVADQRALRLGLHAVGELLPFLIGGGQQPGGLGEGVVAQVQDDLLGGQRLAGGPGRALRLAPAALGAGGHVQQALPGEILDLAQPEHVRIRVGLLEVEHLARRPHRLQRAERVRPPGEQHVHRGQEDVQVLGVHHDHQERHDHRDLRQHEHHLQHAVHPGARAAPASAPRSARRTRRARRGTRRC